MDKVLTMKPISEVLNIDNMAFMKTIPDKFFDLVIAMSKYLKYICV